MRNECISYLGCNNVRNTNISTFCSFLKQVSSVRHFSVVFLKKKKKWLLNYARNATVPVRYVLLQYEEGPRLRASAMVALDVFVGATVPVRTYYGTSNQQWGEAERVEYTGKWASGPVDAYRAIRKIHYVVCKAYVCRPGHGSDVLYIQYFIF